MPITGISSLDPSQDASLDKLRTDLQSAHQARGHHHHHHHHGGKSTNATDPHSQTDPNDPSSFIGTLIKTKA